MDSVKSAAESVLEAKLEALADAGTTEAIGQLVPGIAREIEDTYKPENDRFAYRAVIVILGIVVVVVAITYAWYTLTPDRPGSTLRELPDALIALGSAGVGALAGLLAPAPRNQ